jgi:serine/threonine protein kinase
VPYVAMDLLEGEDLARRLAYRGPLPAQEGVDLLLPVISGLAAAHAAGLVHRDVKPSNNFLARRKLGVEPVVVDFGLAKFAEAAEGAETSGIVGTPQYMAPEQVRGLSATPWSDQWSLGVVFYECLTGGSPFWGHDRYELIDSVMTAPIVPPSEINPDIPRGLDAIVLRALGAALLPFASVQARRRWNDEFAEDARVAGTPNPAPPSPQFGWNGVRHGAQAPRLARRSNAQGGFEIGWVGRVVHAELSGVWDVAMATAFCSSVLGIARELAGRPWAILADSREFPAQSQDVARLRQEAMIKIRRLGCEKIASVSSNAAHAMQFSRITLESRVGSGVFRDEKSALNWIYKVDRDQGSKSSHLRMRAAGSHGSSGLR